MFQARGGSLIRQGLIAVQVLQGFRGIVQRANETADVRRILAEEVDRVSLEVTARQAAPLVASMHSAAERVRASEIDRFESRLAALDDEQETPADYAAEKEHKALSAMLRKWEEDAQQQRRHPLGEPREQARRIAQRAELVSRRRGGEVETLLQLLDHLFLFVDFVPQLKILFSLV